LRYETKEQKRLDIREQMLKRDTSRKSSVEGVTDEQVAMVRPMNILILADAIQRGMIPLENAHSVVCYWFTDRERRDWFEASNKATNRKDNQGKLRDVLGEIIKTNYVTYPNR
jgi:hypothetical protein